MSPSRCRTEDALHVSKLSLQDACSAFRRMSQFDQLMQYSNSSRLPVVKGFILYSSYNCSFRPRATGKVQVR
jgi:hypothetical protein